MVVVPVCIFGSYDGHMYAVRETDGALLARVPLGGSPFASPVALSTEQQEACMVVMATNRGRVAQFRLTLTGEEEQGGGGERAVAVAEEWTHEAGCAIFTTPAVIPGGPAAPPLLVLGGTDGAIRALDPARGGKERWRVDLKCGPIFCPPLAVSVGVHSPNRQGVVVGGQDGSVRWLAAADGHTVWAVAPPSPPPPPPPAVAAAASAAAVALEGGPITGRPALLPGGRAVVVATAAGRLRVLDSGSGSTLAAVVVGAGQRLGSPTVRAEGGGGGVMVVVGSRDDGVYGVRLRGAEEAEPGSVHERRKRRRE